MTVDDPRHGVTQGRLKAPIEGGLVRLRPVMSVAGAPCFVPPASSGEDSFVGRPAIRCGLPWRSPLAGLAAEDDIRGRARNAAERVLLPAEDVVLHERSLIARGVRVLVGQDDGGDVRRHDRVVDELDAGRQRHRALGRVAHVDREEHVLVRAREEVRLDVDVVHRPRRARTRVDVELRGAVVAHAEARALDRPRPAPEDLDQVVVVVAVRAGQRVVQVGVADHDVIGGTADHVGVEDVVEEDVVDHESLALGEDAGEAVLAVRELGSGDRHVAIARIELERDAAILVGAQEAHVAERDGARVEHLRHCRLIRRLDAQVAHDDALRAPDRDAREDRRRPPDELDRRARREVEELQRRHLAGRQPDRATADRDALELGREPGRILGELVERIGAVLAAIHHAVRAVGAGREHAQQHRARNHESALT